MRDFPPRSLHRSNIDSVVLLLTQPIRQDPGPAVKRTNSIVANNAAQSRFTCVTLPENPWKPDMVDPSITHKLLYIVPVMPYPNDEQLCKLQVRNAKRRVLIND